MARRCEVCENLSPDAVETRKLHRFLVEDRVVALCNEHAYTFRERRPDTLADMAQLFREEAGHRSLLSRRAPIERRQFPMRPEGRRRTTGRRVGDVG
jgi:hypothetical protein